MDLVELPVDRLQEAPWNANVMDEAMLQRLRGSITCFGTVQNLVVRPSGNGCHEVLSGNQRLRVMREIGMTAAPCVVVDLEDAQARLLAQALNRIQGVDDLGLKAELVREILSAIPQSEVVALLPESAESLQALASLGETDLAQHLQVWQKAQAAKLHHFTAQLTKNQIEVVEEAMARVMAGPTNHGDSPNRRGNALYQICLNYLSKGETE